MRKIIKEAFVVIGKEGSTLDDAGFIQKLWNDANSHFSEVEHLAKKDTKGNLVGIWGAMSDFSHAFMPWEDGFSNGLYLAGVECVAPDPGFQKKVNHMIYDQIKAGYPVSREAIMEVIDHMRGKGCDAVIMGCTELSVIYRDLKLRET